MLEKRPRPTIEKVSEIKKIFVPLNLFDWRSFALAARERSLFVCVCVLVREFEILIYASPCVCVSISVLFSFGKC